MITLEGVSSIALLFLIGFVEAGSTSSTIDLTAASVLNAALSTSSIASISATTTTSIQNGFITKVLQSSSSDPTAATGAQTSTTLLPLASRLPAVSQTADAVVPEQGGFNDATLAIILGTVIGGVAAITMLVVLWCALRHNASTWREYARTPSPTMSDSAGKTMRAVTSRKIFSSRSANAPEVLHRSDSASARGHRRGPSALQIYHPNDSEKGLALDNIDESPQLTPLTRSFHSLHQRGTAESQHPAQRKSGEMPVPATRRPSGERQTSQTSLLRQHARSVDVLEHTGRRSMDTQPRRSSVSPGLHRRPSDDRNYPFSPPMPPYRTVSPYVVTTPVSNHSSEPFFKTSDEARRSNEATPPRVPARSPHRTSSPVVHYPSWAETQQFDFDDSDGQRGSRERPSLAMARRSGSWKPERAAGRHELE